jgi:lysozyme family protein
MSDFKIAVLKTLKNEGGYVNDPADPGGATNFGIIQADMPGVDMQTITQDQAVQYYAQHYWKPLYSQIEDQSVADKLFDMGVLFGVGTAVKNLQQALTSGFTITVDGIFGAETLSAINQADGPSLLTAYKTLLITHIFAIATAKPQTRKFLTGWGKRINS